MDIAELQIKRDLSRLLIPVKYKHTGFILRFSLDIDKAPYHGTFNFQLEFPENYPFSSPRLLCLTKTFHPNIDENGNTCLKILREGWMPTYDINSIIVSLYCAFTDPSTEDALNTEAASLLQWNYPAFLQRVAEAHSE